MLPLKIAAYAAFAGISIAANLAAQWMTIKLLAVWSLPKGLSLWPALMVGTGTGLILKYVLDKRFIFRDRSSGLRSHARAFSLYSAMGLVTTAIFWGVEAASYMVDRSGRYIYLGGALGLIVGYTIKYNLDRLFVFRTSDQQ